MSNDPALASVADLSQAIGRGELSSAYLVERLLDRIHTSEPDLNAFVAVYEDEVRAAADGADKAIQSGHRIGPLHGIPIALKDVVELEGYVTTGGSQVWNNRISKVTATVARRLIAAGMIIIGKTQSVEFAFGGWGTNEYMGTPWNPWDAEVPRTPGGSSSGSAVAVAARLVPGAVGTDAAGSISLPAAWCGVTGLKTTVGRVSRHGILPLSRTFDTVGPITRAVEDAALLYNAMAGPDSEDPLTQARPVQDPVPSLRRGVAGLRLATIPEYEREIADTEVLANYDASIEKLSDLGAEIVPANLPYRFAEINHVVGRIIACEVYAVIGHLAEQHDLPVDKDVRRRVQTGKDVLARDYLSALDQRVEMRHAFRAALKDIDALLTPTTTTGAIPIDEVDQGATASVFTRFVNLLNHCAVTLPNGFTSELLPTSLQIVGGEYEEGTVLRIGWALEQATSWSRSVPPTLIQ